MTTTSKTSSAKLLKRLNGIIEMTALINSSLSTGMISKRAVEAATKLLESEAGSLLLRDMKTGELYFDVAVGLKSKKMKEVRLPKGKGISGWVVEHNKSVIIHDVNKDPRFYSEADKISKFVTRNMVCVPLRAKKRTIGVLQAVNKIKGKFTNDDLSILQSFADQVAIAIENARLFEEAVTDGLTGLIQRRYFELRLREEMERAKRYGYPVSLVMIDIDHFKKVNDTYGHQEGDTVLIGIASVLERAVRMGDIAARFGGEEFVLILPHTERANAVKAAERLRANIEKQTFGGHSVTISAGVGFMTSKDREMQSDDLVRMADEALYFAKNNGRNMVYCHEK